MASNFQLTKFYRNTYLWFMEESMLNNLRVEPSTGLVWQQTSGLFSRWKEVFLILTKDCLRYLVHISVSIDVEILISSLQVPQDLGLSQDSSVWWSPLESGPGAHVRREVRGEERLPHSLSGGPGNTQDLPQEDRWH